MSFYGGTYIDYCNYCDDRYSGIFKLKENENIFSFKNCTHSKLYIYCK